jgi:lipoprotein NlpD
MTPLKPPAGVPGTYHKVEKGQTLWRISKTYGVDLDEIIKFNRISDVTKIEVNQLIFIPRASGRKTVSSVSSDEDFIWPIKGKVISTFGATYDNVINKGLNIEPYYNGDVIASRGGRVVFYSDKLESFGKTLIIDHGDGLLTVYSRNSKVFVKLGDNITRGTLIAKAGKSKRGKKEYLHFEIRKNSIPQNPYYFLP